MNEVGIDPIQAPTYKDFIKEVFMDPIRTAVVVDDEYPTLEEFLKLSDGEVLSEPAKRENKQRVHDIIQFCRAQKPKPWLIDVHDGKSPSKADEAEMVTHFDHTDLLILDYHLDRLQGSERSIEILRKLAGNDHFNLVAIYTNDQRGDGIEKTINEVVLSLLCPSESFRFERHTASKIAEWEDSKEGVFKALQDALDEAAFVKIMELEKTSFDSWQKWKELASFKALTDNVPPGSHVSADKILKHFMYLKQELLRKKMSTSTLGAVTHGIDGSVNWIRTDSLFVTVIPKSEHADTIPEKILTALVAWDPVPHRLILSKMRTELTHRGGGAETGAMSNPHLHEAWLRDLLVESKQQRRTNVRLDAIRYWEGLGGVVRPGVISFSDRLAEFLASEGREKVLQRFGKDTSLFQQEMEMHLHINCYVCSKPIEGHHLATGHVFKKKEGNFWLCLSPACDLEPDRKAGWKKRLGNWMPLKAVRLYPAKSEIALKDSSSGNYVFLLVDNGIKAFGFRQLESGTVSGGFEGAISKNERDPTLAWEQLFAEDHGHFKDATNTFKVGSIVERNGSLQIDTDSAEVVAQLRYEYALNLLQKLGVHLSRVGLDFRSYEHTSTPLSFG